MKIKIGNKIYDSENEPIMLILSVKDKSNIANMHSKCTKYCCFPDSIDKDVIEKFMDTENAYDKIIRIFGKEYIDAVKITMKNDVVTFEMPHDENKKLHNELLEADNEFVNLSETYAMQAAEVLDKKILEPEIDQELVIHREPVMTNDELIKKVKHQIFQLARTGGKSHIMCVPPETTDTDMLLSELVKRFEKLLTS